MAEFCKQCHREHFGPGVENDFAGRSTPEETEAQLYALVLCEGCGPCQVDDTGKCVSDDCLEKHGLRRDGNGKDQA